MGLVWNDIRLLAGHLGTTFAAMKLVRERFVGVQDTGPKLVVTSGGFDPLHVGHVRCILAAAKLGDCLVVVVNGDGFLTRKKGYAFMSLAERLEVVAAVAGVDHAVAWDDGSQFVAGALEVLRPTVFAKGGDRSTLESVVPEELAACRRVGCYIALSVGGADKVQSSSGLVRGVSGGV